MRRTLAAAFAAALALSILMGCAAKSAIVPPAGDSGGTPLTTPSIQASSGLSATQVTNTVDPAAANERARISVPEQGAMRTALMDAARKYMALPSGRKFFVWQLLVQGKSAIGDIQVIAPGGAVTGPRSIVALQKVGDTWTATGSWPTLDAKRSSVLQAAPYLTTKIASQIVFFVPFATPSKVKTAAQSSSTRVIVPTRIPEGWTFSYEAKPYPGETGWHLQHYKHGKEQIDVFVGSPEGAFTDQLAGAPLRILDGAGAQAYLLTVNELDNGYSNATTRRTEVGTEVGIGSGLYSTYLFDLKNPASDRIRAIMSAMSMSMKLVKP